MGRGDAGERHGCTWHPLQMITGDNFGAMIRKQASSTRQRSAKLSTSYAAMDAGSRPILRRRCPVSAGKLFFRRIIWQKFIGECAGRAVFASLMKCKWDSDGWARISGDLKRKEWFPISS